MADDFSALGFDPARGNVGTVRDLAKQMTDTGKYANEAFEVLKGVKDKQEIWTGTAARAFTDRLGPLPEYLDKSQESLTKAGTALSTWSDKLEAHHDELANSKPRRRGPRARRNRRIRPRVRLAKPRRASRTTPICTTRPSTRSTRPTTPGTGWQTSGSKRRTCATPGKTTPTTALISSRTPRTPLRRSRSGIRSTRCSTTSASG